MRVIKLLIPLSLAALVAYLVIEGPVGLGIEERSSPPVRITTAETVDEADALVPFDLHVPSRIPRGVEFRIAQYWPLGGGPVVEGEAPEGAGPSEGDIVALYYGGPETSANIVLWQTAGTIKVAGAAETIEVNGVTGEIVRGESFGERPRPGYVTIQWKKGGMSYSATSTLDEQWTLDDLLEVLASIE